MMNRSRAFEFAVNQRWAIQRPYLKLILDVARRAHVPNLEAVAQRQADRESQDGIRQDYGPVAVINVIGPIFRYANLFTAISGATSLEDIGRQFAAALDDPEIERIVFYIDSPGGEVTGISELSQVIYAARGRKLIEAYAGDLMASAAYWIGSAAERVLASPTALIGSIGVLATITREEEIDGETTYEFVSSASPKKTVDLETDAGRAQIQAVVDDLGAVFVADVARNRGVSPDVVLANFGQGDVLIASKAVTVGMADEITTFDALLSATARRSGVYGGKTAMSEVVEQQTAAAEAPAVPPAATVPPPVEDARAAALSYAAEVAELCSLAGQPSRAAEFIRAGTTLAEVKRQLQTARVAEDASTQVHSHVLPETAADSGRSAQTATDPKGSPLIRAAEKLAQAGKEK